MIFSFLRRRKQEQGIEPLYGAMMANALNPRLYSPGNVPDTFEGRFEAVTLHAALLLRRLAELPPPAAAMAQDLVDRIFDGLDSAMREVGVSDVGVPKRMKSFAKGFYGRLEAYTAALAPGADVGALADVVSRNVLEGGVATPALCRYILETRESLAAAPIEALMRGDYPAAPFAQGEA